MRKVVKELKERTVFVSGGHCETALFMMKFHFLDDLNNDLGMSQRVRFQDSPAYGYSNPDLRDHT